MGTAQNGKLSGHTSCVSKRHIKYSSQQMYLSLLCKAKKVLSRHASHVQQECEGRSKSVLTGISRMAWCEELVISPARERGVLRGEGHPGSGADKLGWLTCFSVGIPLNRGQRCPITGVWAWEDQTKGDFVKTVETMCMRA